MLSSQQISSLPTHHSSQGFTLIEVLIAILLISVGLLGTTQLQLTSFNESRNALYRNQATVIAEDLLDRIRANRSELEAGGAYLSLSFDGDSSPQTPIDCTAGCDATELAQRDVAEWARNFNGVIRSLPDARGTGTAAGACGGGIRYRVAVSWALIGEDRESIDRESVNMEACL